MHMSDENATEKHPDIPMITGEVFDQEVLKSDQPVLVDFYADWCGPCKLVKPIINELAAGRSDVKVVKVDVDKEQELVQRYGIAGVPMVCLFKDGGKINEMVGAGPLKMYNEFLDSSLPEPE